MGSFLAEYAENNGLKVGDVAGRIRLPHRAVARARAQPLHHEADAQRRQGQGVHPADEALDPDSRRAYDAAQRVIDKLKIDIPVSPIDWIRNEFAKAGSHGRRNHGSKLVGRLQRPEEPEAVATRHEGAEGQGAHDAPVQRWHAGRADPERRRLHGHQPACLGALQGPARSPHDRGPGRAGHQHLHADAGPHPPHGPGALPKYTILNADLPAEIRPTALLSKKMKSLNANTSSNTESRPRR
jgi:hypothetical protein